MSVWNHTRAKMHIGRAISRVKVDFTGWTTTTIIEKCRRIWTPLDGRPATINCIHHRCINTIVVPWNWINGRWPAFPVQVKAHLGVRHMTRKVLNVEGPESRKLMTKISFSQGRTKTVAQVASRPQEMISTTTDQNLRPRQVDQIQIFH